MSSRAKLLESTLAQMYRAVSFIEGDEPDWALMNSVFLPTARLTRITPEGVDHFDITSFQAMARDMLEWGAYTSFFEVEIARNFVIFGDLAHVLSAYEAKKNAKATYPLSRGLNSLQLIWTTETWRVLSLVWDEETDHNPLDLAKLFNQGEYCVQRPSE
jgi:hypothetical protein